MDLDLISIMVLLVKHVHLQNVGAAGQNKGIWLVLRRQNQLARTEVSSNRANSQAATATEASAPIQKRRIASRFILKPVIQPA